VEPIRRPLVPTVGVLALGFAAIGLQRGPIDRPVLAAAVLVALAAIAAAAAGPWGRLPLWALLGLACACDAVIALLRQTGGGNGSGYGPLAILPVLWVALVLRRREVAGIVVATFLLFAVPIVVVGGTMYPSTGWRSVVLWTIVAGVVGIVTNRVVRDEREQTRLIEEQSGIIAARAEELDQLVATQTAIATSSFDLDTVMRTAAAEAQRLTGAEAAVVEIPDGEDLVYRAACGTAEPYLGFRLRQEGAISGLALRTGEIVLCDDSELDERVDRDACRRVGARSMVVVPLLHDGKAAGVLKVYSNSVAAFDGRHAQLLSMIATLIGAAIARSNLLADLNEMAVTDALTELPNRRAWYERLDRAMARARRSGAPLTVVVLDLDGFKHLNDSKGHERGDRLLRTLGRQWPDAVRETDFLGRTGGDEFAVVLEDADRSAVDDVVARIRERTPPSQEVSAGFATWDGNETAASLVSRADAEMYANKAERRRVPA
jgi:diguanylate cyclase (GGDEF)-like protein